jgi:hypothetical protein
LVPGNFRNCKAVHFLAPQANSPVQRRRRVAVPPTTMGRLPSATSCLLAAPRVALHLLAALPFALEPFTPRHATPTRFCGCHLAATVASIAQSLGSPSRVRPNTGRSPASVSPRSLACSLPRLPKPAPPFIRNTGELKPLSTRLTAAPPPALTPQLAPLEPRTSPWPLLVAYRPLKPLAVELCRRAELRRPLLTVERIAPDLLRSIQPLH